MEETINPAIIPQIVAHIKADIGLIPARTKAPYVHPPSVTQLSQVISVTFTIEVDKYTLQLINAKISDKEKIFNALSTRFIFIHSCYNYFFRSILSMCLLKNC